MDNHTMPYTAGPKTVGAGSGLSEQLDASERLKFFAQKVKEGWGFCAQCGVTAYDEDGTCPTCGATVTGQALTALAEDIKLASV